MKLTFKTPHLSIKGLPETDLPPFTLVTGVNGAGKTHLLRAIECGRISVDVAPNPEAETRFFDWNTLVPNDAGQARTHQLYAERDQILEWGKAARRKNQDTLLHTISKFGISENWTRDPWEILGLSSDELASLCHGPQEAQDAFQSLRAVGEKAAKEVRRHVRNNQQMQELLQDVCGGQNERLAWLRQSDFDERPLGWNRIDLFQQSFAQMFLAYFELQKLNRLHALDHAEGRGGVMPLTEEQFIEKHGEPPWDFVNQTLRKARLDFEINQPESYTITTFQPRLTKISNGADILFSALSSGERILMSFAFCLYYSLDERQMVHRPKLLLFDEIDAPLHPSMSRTLVETITGTIVEKHGIPVIMSTHLPSTVAVAPEESVHVMRPNEPGLRPIGKRQAIAVLTSEIPTLSIEFDGRRQVFVESQRDAERNDLLYRHLSSELSSERSLVFVGVGRRDRGGNVQNAGCSQVQQLVSALSEGGNTTVFGLLDWDTTNEPTDRIVILAHGERYAIENCLLDPLLLATVAIRERREQGQELGLRDDETALDLDGMPIERLQQIINVVQRRVLELPREADLVGQKEVRYSGGFVLRVSKDYLEKQGHTLEEAARNAFPHLRRFHRDGGLLAQIIDPVIVEFPRFVPMVLLNAFEQLLSMEP